MEYFIRNGELYHWGVPGMRWGVRRYQNADGSLTDAGKKRLSKERQKNLKKARESKAERQRLLKSGKMPASQMTDAELKAKIERLRQEQTYNDLVKNTAQVNKGKQFVKSYMGDAAKKIIWENGVDIVKQVVKHYGVEVSNDLIKQGKLNKMQEKAGKKFTDEEVSEIMKNMQDVIFTNNKKKS